MKQTVNKEPSLVNKAASAFIVAVVMIGFLWFSVTSIGLELDFSTLSQYRQRLWEGFLMTVIISLASLIVSLIIGSLTAIGQNARILAISYFCRAYVQIIRGTPLLVQIYFFYYIIGTAWGIDNRYVAGVVRKSFAGAWRV